MNGGGQAAKSIVMHREHCTNTVASDGAVSILAEIEKLPSHLELSRTPAISLFDISEDLLIYLLSVLRGEEPLLPEASMEQWFSLLHVLKSHWIIPFLYGQISNLSEELRPPGPIR